MNDNQTFAIRTTGKELSADVQEATTTNQCPHVTEYISLWGKPRWRCQAHPQKCSYDTTTQPPCDAATWEVCRKGPAGDYPIQEGTPCQK